MSIYTGSTPIKEIYYTDTKIKAVYSGTTRIYPSQGIVSGAGYSYGYITGQNFNLKVRYQEDITNGGALFVNDQTWYNNLRGIQVTSAGTYYVSYSSYVVRASSSSALTDTLTLWRNNGEGSSVSITCNPSFAANPRLSQTWTANAGDIFLWSWDRQNGFWDGISDINFHVEKVS